MKKRHMMIASLALAAMAAVTSCGPYRIKGHADPLQEKEKIVLKDHAARRRLRLVKHDAERLPSGQLLVRLEIENKREEAFHADIQFIFRDEKGFEIEATNWQPYLLHGHRVTLVQQNSITPNAADYRILIKKME